MLRCCVNFILLIIILILVYRVSGFSFGKIYIHLDHLHLYITLKTLCMTMNFKKWPKTSAGQNGWKIKIMKNIKK